MMSPTTADGAEPRNAVPTAMTAMLAKKITRAMDSDPVARSSTTRSSMPPMVAMEPMSMAGRRPRRSVIRPAGTRKMAWTTAATRNAHPDRLGPCSRPWTTKSGMSAARSPKTVKPVTKLTASAAR